MRSIAVFVMLLCAPAIMAEERLAPPGNAPIFWLASAKERGGKVTVQLYRPGALVPPVDPNEKPIDGKVWTELRPVTLDQTIHAFASDGKPLDAKAVLKALKEPKGAAVFLRSYGTDPTTPPEFYRRLIREGVVIFVANAEDLYNPRP